VKIDKKGQGGGKNGNGRRPKAKPPRDAKKRGLDLFEDAQK